MQPTARIRLTNYPYSALSKMTYNQGEIVYDETNGTLRLLDGVTQGGIALANQAWTQTQINQAIATSVTWPVAGTSGLTGPLNIQIGFLAGELNQGTGDEIGGAIALGIHAGYSNQGVVAVAMGAEAGKFNQGSYTLSLGSYAGNTNQSPVAVALGASAGEQSQGYGAVAVGGIAGYENQSAGAVSVGYAAGATNQGTNAVAMGLNAANTGQSVGAVALGYRAGQTSQGLYSIAVGSLAGVANQADRTIVLNATGTEFSGVANQTNSLYINPIRNSTASVTNYLYYNTTTKEVTYAPSPDSGVVAGSYTGSVTVNSKGVVTQAAQLTLANVTTALGYTPLSTSGTQTLTGALNITGTMSISGAVTVTANPTQPNQVVNKAYIDSKIWLALAVGL